MVELDVDRCNVHGFQIQTVLGFTCRAGKCNLITKCQKCLQQLFHTTSGRGC